jgi:hypothetical protein
MCRSKLDPWWITAFAFNILIIFLLLLGHYHYFLIPCWTASLLLPLFSRQQNARIPQLFAGLKFKTHFILLLFALMPLVVRLLMIDPQRIHSDEYLIAGNSIAFDFKADNFFSFFPKVYLWPGGQTPSIMYVLQKIYLHIFGTTFDTVKYSALPYILGTSFFLALSAHAIGGMILAFITCWLYSFLAIDLYYALLGGIHQFSGSMFVFTGFFWVLVSWKKNYTLKDSYILGLLSGSCYLYYYTSFIALPVVFTFGGLLWYVHRRWPWRRWMAGFIGGNFLVLSPNIAQMISEKKFIILLPRWDLINIWNGYWTPRYQESFGLFKKISMVGENLWTFLRSFAVDRLGGCCGFHFSNLAMFEYTGLALLLIGVGLLVFYCFRKYPRRRLWILILLAVLWEFPGVILTFPMASYHRFSAVFPLLALIMAVPLAQWLVLKPVPLSARIMLALLVLPYFAYANLCYLRPIIKEEIKISEFQLVERVGRNFPDHRIYVSAFPGHQLPHVLRFSTYPNLKKVVWDSAVNLYPKFNKNERYFYIIAWYEETADKYKQLDKKGVYEIYNKNYAFFYKR